MGTSPGSAYVVLLTNALTNFSALSLLISDLYLRSKELKKIKKQEKRDQRIRHFHKESPKSNFQRSHEAKGHQNPLLPQMPSFASSLVFTLNSGSSQSSQTALTGRDVTSLTLSGDNTPTLQPPTPPAVSQHKSSPIHFSLPPPSTLDATENSICVPRRHSKSPKQSAFENELQRLFDNMVIPSNSSSSPFKVDDDFTKSYRITPEFILGNDHNEQFTIDNNHFITDFDNRSRSPSPPMNSRERPPWFNQVVGDQPESPTDFGWIRHRSLEKTSTMLDEH